MKILESLLKLKKSNKNTILEEKNVILHYLNELQRKEAKLWGIIITDVKNGEESIIEDTSHIIYLMNKNHDTLFQFLSEKSIRKFQADLDSLRKDFLVLKKAIKDQDKLKLLISNFTIKLVDSKNYDKFKNVFLLERYLYDVLDKQEIELNRIIADYSKIKIPDTHDKVETFKKSLKELREVLSGHLDNFKHFEMGRSNYSNTSNIIYELVKLFKQDLD